MPKTVIKCGQRARYGHSHNERLTGSVSDISITFSHLYCIYSR